MTRPTKAPQRYLVLWNSPQMLSTEEAAAWVAREIQAVREALGNRDIGCWPTEGDAGPGWLLEIWFDSEDVHGIEEGLRDLVNELQSLRLRPRVLVTGAAPLSPR